MQRLSSQALPTGTGIELPRYDKNSLSSGIVHIGCGAFHRAHAAWYTHRLLQQKPGNWLITGVNLHSHGTYDQLMPQDCYYSLHSESLIDNASMPTWKNLSNDNAGVVIVGSIKEILPPSAAGALRRALVSESTRVVSLTVTEKGYYLVNSGLDTGHSDILQDLKNPSTPITVIGILTQALKLRFEEGFEPFTVLSCDNLMQNGPTLKRLVLAYAELIDPGLSRLIDEHVAFPATMVDRIVPSVSAKQVKHAADRLGVIDHGPIYTEPFSQWVIEDTFCNARPAWEDVGVIFSSRVEQFEQMKLQLLNAAHSAIAYLGCIGGFELVSDCMANDYFRRYINALMAKEILPTIEQRLGDSLSGFDLNVYVEDLMQRFSNPGLQHRCQQIATDGSKKLPQRTFATLRYCLRSSLPIRHLATAIAGWMIYVSGRNLQAGDLTVKDPLATSLAGLVAGSKNDHSLIVQNLLQHSTVFPDDLAQSRSLQSEIIKAMHCLQAGGLDAAFRYCHDSQEDAF